MVQRCAVFGSCQPCENVRQVAELIHASQVDANNLKGAIAPHLALEVCGAKTEMRQRAKTLHEPRDKTDEVTRSEEVVALKKFDQVAINAQFPTEALLTIEGAGFNPDVGIMRYSAQKR